MINTASGVMTADGGTLTLGTGTNTVANAGTVQAINNGIVNLAGTISNLSGNALTGGTWRAASGGDIIFQGTTDAIATNAANLVLDGAGSTIQTRTGPSSTYQQLEQTLTTNNGSLAVLGNRDFAATNALTNNGTLQLGGGALSSPALTNNASGLLTGFGTVNVRPTNAGTIEAAGSTLTLVNGISGSAGTVRVLSGATMNLSGGASGTTAGSLVQDGTLSLGTNNVTVSTSYTNANFGSGNSFNARAGVTGSGQILAGGDVGQAITGAQVVNGTTANAVLNLGNFREGQLVSATFNVANTGTNGPELRGALQTSVNGANITDPRLTGSGVTAGNFDPIAAGASRSFTVNFDGTTAGAITGQSVHVANNFDNVADQSLQIVGGGVFRAAQGSASPDPMSLGNARVGGTLAGSLAVTNVAGNTGGYTETLGATISGTSGAASASGSISGLAYNAAPSTAIGVSLNTATAGVRTGTVDLAYTSSEINGSGLGTISVGAQTVDLSGTVYQAAQAGVVPASPINLGNVRVGGTLGTNLTIANVAPNTSGFTETLGGSVTGTTGGATASGSFSGVAQGASSNAISVGLNAGSAGALSGTATLGFTSSEINGSGLGTIGAGSQVVSLTGAAYRLAEANLGTLAFGNVLQNSSQSRFLSVSNGAIADGYSEGLNALLGAFSGGSSGLLSGSGSITNLAAGLTDASGLLVTLNTGSTGSVTANVQVILASNGAGTSGLGITALPSQNVAIDGLITGVVGSLASASSATPNPVNLGNVRVGAVSPTQALTISNTAAGPAEGLNASFTGASAGLTTTGSFAGLATGATNSTSLVVGMNTAAGGSRNGSVTITPVSDGSFNSGVTTNLTPQNVAVTGAVYQTAQAGVLPASPIDLGATRIGGTLGQALTVTNTAPNTGGFTETLGGSVTGTTGAASAGGSFASVAQGTSSNAISVGLNTATAGAVTGSATLGFSSSEINGSGLGTIGAGSQTVNLTGAVYQAAQAGVLPTSPINLGNVHVGDTLGANLSVTNIAPNTAGFTETLGGTVTGTTGGATASGSFSGVAQGASSNAIGVGLNTATAGALSGTATLGFTSSEINSSGLGTIGAGSQVVSLTGAAYRFAEANLGTLNFGNVLQNSSQSRFLSVNNGAIADGFSEGLNALLGSFSGTSFSLLSGSGAVTNLAAGLTDASGLLVTLNTGSTGSVTASVQVILASNGAGTSGLGITALPSQNVAIDGLITGVVGSLASASSATPNPVNLGNVRVGAVSPTQALTISNTVAGPAEGLNASFTGATAGLTATGSFAGLAPGATNSSSLVVGMNTATGGSRNGTVTVAPVSDGSFNSGVTTNLTPQQVAVTGAVYQTAQAGVLPASPIDLGATRVGGTLGQALTITNSAPNTGGYTETLGGSVTGTTGAASASGSFAGVAQGSSSNAISVGLSTGTAGAVSGSAALGFTSSEINGSGLGTIGAGSQSVNLTGAVYQAAQAGVVPTTVGLGTMRSGTVVNTALTIANVAPNTVGYTETLGATFGTASAGLVGTGTLTGLTAGSTSNALTVAFTAGGAGSYNGAVNLNFASQAINGSGLGNLALAPQAVNFAALVNGLATFDLSNNGPFAFSFTGANSALLDFGTVGLGGGTLLNGLNLFNHVSGPADSLVGSIGLSSLTGSPFSFLGNSSFNLNAGAATLFQLGFNTGAGAGFYSSSIAFTSASHNAFQTDLGLGAFTLEVRGSVRDDVGVVPVPEPSTYGLMAALLLAGVAFARRRKRGQV
ncbi:MAG: choice-of-anchor D domain-containing protein [Opitutaceae bacterium]